jgi:hypothetical protein
MPGIPKTLLNRCIALKRPVPFALGLVRWQHDREGVTAETPSIKCRINASEGIRDRTATIGAAGRHARAGRPLPD